VILLVFVVVVVVVVVVKLYNQSLSKERWAKGLLRGEELGQIAWKGINFFYQLLINSNKEVKIPK